MEPNKTCRICGRLPGKKETAFVLRVELFADPSPPVIAREDLEKDLRAEMEQLIQDMENVDPEEARDEVHERYEYWVCAACRRRLHFRLKYPFLQLE